MISLIIAGIFGAITTFAVTAEPSYKEMLKFSEDKSYPLYVDVKHNQFIGTGFIVEGKSGQKYMMTAGHVCDAAESEKLALFTDIQGTSVVFFGWKSLNVHDICILGKVSNSLPHYKMGPKPQIGDKLYGLGHPSGWPRTVMSGNVVGDIPVKIRTDRSLDKCNGAYKKFEMKFMGIPMGEVCAIDAEETAVTMSVAPGASGSPVVDRYGRLVGIISAEDTSTANWLLMVPQEKLAAVIEKL
jgi:S1-C subfamily serine protease